MFTPIATSKGLNVPSLRKKKESLETPGPQDSLGDRTPNYSDPLLFDLRDRRSTHPCSKSSK